MLNCKHNLTGLQLGDIDRGSEQNFTQGWGLRPEVQPLALLYTSFHRKSTPFESHFVNITNDIPFTYRKLSCLFHSYKIHLLGPRYQLAKPTNPKMVYLWAFNDVQFLLLTLFEPYTSITIIYRTKLLFSRKQWFQMPLKINWSVKTPWYWSTGIEVARSCFYVSRGKGTLFPPCFLSSRLSCHFLEGFCQSF